MIVIETPLKFVGFVCVFFYFFSLFIFFFRKYFFAHDENKVRDEWMQSLISNSSTMDFLSFEDPKEREAREAERIKQVKRAAAQAALQANAVNFVDDKLDHYLDIMERGSVLVKFPYLGRGSGTPKARFFQLSSDTSLVKWGTSKDHLNRQISINEIKKVVSGPNSNTFKKHYKNQYLGKWRAFSLLIHIFEDEGNKRTLDLLAMSDEEAEAWSIGIESIINSGFDTKAAIERWKWKKLRMSTEEKAFMRGISFGEAVSESIHSSLSG